MVLIVTLVIIFLAFLLSYSQFKKEVHKTKKERIKSMQVFVLSWVLIAVVAVALYFAFCYYTGESIL